MCQELSEISMFDAFGKRPFPWQRTIITHLNLMTCPTSGIPPSPTFLCTPAGGGIGSLHVSLLMLDRVAFLAPFSLAISWCWWSDQNKCQLCKWQWCYGSLPSQPLSPPFSTAIFVGVLHYLLAPWTVQYGLHHFINTSSSEQQTLLWFVSDITI